MSKFLLVTQTEKCSNPPPNSLILTWKTESPGCLYLPDSTWAEGRNHLRNHILQNKDEFNYDYYFFCDDDVQFLKGDWDEIKKICEESNPFMAVPNIPGFYASPLSEYTYEFDAVISIYSKEAFFDDRIWPLSTYWDEESWWYSLLIHWHQVNYWHPQSVKMLKEIEIGNTLGRNYPRAADYKKVEKWILEEGVLPSITPTPRVDDPKMGEIYGSQVSQYSTMDNWT